MLKIFELKHQSGDIEWIVAATNVAALLCYLRTTECDTDTIEDSTIEELPSAKWSEYNVTIEDSLGADKEMTFEEYMQNENNDTTELFCSTIEEDITYVKS